VQQAALLDNLCVSPMFSKAQFSNKCSSLSDDSWHVFLKKFAVSVQHITGQELEVRAASDSNSRDIVEQELEELRIKVEELSDEVSLGRS
jgi:hypothetical protein